MRSHSEFIRAQKKFYRNMGHVICPALGNAKVFFNNKGFTHLLKKRGIFRPPREQKRRMMLLRFCKDILEDATVEIYTRHTTQSRDATRFWSVQKQIGQMNIKIVLRQNGYGRIHFFSIYSN